MSLYDIWKTERRVWAEGPQACAEHILIDALITPPAPMPALTAKALIAFTRGARPFSDVDLGARTFVQAGDTIVIRYIASAQHPRYKNRYFARCSTTYARVGEGWKVAAHHHTRLSRKDAESLLAMDAASAIAEGAA